MNILLLRSNAVNPDARVEKEVAALREAGFGVSVFGWDRSISAHNTHGQLAVGDVVVPIKRCCIRSKFGGSIVEMMLPLVMFQCKLAAFLLKHRKEYDIIHACDFDTAFTSVLLGKLLRKRAVYDIFDYYVDAFGIPGWLRPLVAGLDHIAMSLADVVIVCTEQRRHQIPKLKQEKVIVVQNAPSVEAVMPAVLTRPPHAIQIGYFGILQEGRLIEALVDIVAHHPEYQLEIGGFGLLEEYIAKVAQEHDNVHFYGKVPYRRVLELESACDVLTAIYDPAIPNHRYSAPNKFYEGMALGKPLIVCEGTCVDETVRKLSCGAVIPCTREGLEQAIADLVAVQSQWAEMSQRMQTHYNECLRWEISKEILVHRYQEFTAVANDTI